MELGGEDVVLPNRRGKGLTVIRPRGNNGWIDRLRIKAVHKIDVAAAGNVLKDRTIRAGDFKLVPADLRDFKAIATAEFDDLTLENAEAGIRVVNLRFGIILHPSGGALKMMLPPFRLGLGGPLGSGRQWMSWVTREDVVGIILLALANASLQGPVNAVAPNPVTNAEFTKALGKVLSRPTIFPVPAFAVKLAFGEMGEEALLGSQRVEPARLQATGYKFRSPDLEATLRRAAGKG